MSTNYKETIKRLALDSPLRYYIDEEAIIERTEGKNIEVTEDPTFEVTESTISIPINKELNDQTEHELLQASILAVGLDECDTELDRYLKELIASYFANKSKKSDITTGVFANQTFTCLSPYSKILENIIAELAQVVYDKGLADTLLHGTLDLSVTIDQITKTKNLGHKFTAQLSRLIELYNEVVTCEKITHYNKSLYANKLNKVVELIRKNKTYIFEPMSANILEKNDFNLRKTFYRDQIGPEEELTEDEKKVIREYINMFNRSSTIHFRESIWIPTSQYTFIDKVNSSVLYYQQKKELVYSRFLTNWRELQNLLIKVIIPRAYSHGNIDTFDLDMITKLGSYESDGINSFDLNNNSKIHKLKQKLNNNNL